MLLNKKQLKLFKTLSELNGISGQENEVARFLKKTYLELGYEIKTDRLGSIFAFKKSKVKNAPVVVVAAHMDEVGFIVTLVNENGLVNVAPVGGVNPQTLYAKRVLVRTKDGQFLEGVIDSTPPHLIDKNAKASDIDISKMLVDFGFTNKEEVLNAGINSGSMIVVKGDFITLNNGKRLLGKAFDDRYGLVLGIEILQYFKDKELPFDFYVGGTVQEEVGLRGATTSANLLNPDLVIVLDCSPARDSNFANIGEGQLGGGLLLRYHDRSMLSFPELIAYQEEMAKKAKVKTQYFSSPGGTDAGAFHKSGEGVLTLTHCICARNLHTCSTLLDVEDYLAAKKTLITLLKDFDQERLNKLKGARR